MASRDGRDSERTSTPGRDSPLAATVTATPPLTLDRLKRGLARRLGFLPTATPAPTLPVPSAREGGPVAGLDLAECQVFFGYMRLHAYAMLAEVERYTPEQLRAGMRVALEVEGEQPVQRSRILSVQPSGAIEFEVDALVPRDVPMERVFLLTWFGDGLSRFPMEIVLPHARALDKRSKLPDFKAAVRGFAAAEGRRPALLDVGGRARSGIQRSEEYPDCDVTVFDIVADPGVDVVGDAHALSTYFPPDSFDFAMSVAVFEHLLMPWKVAVEMNRVLRPGGLAYVHSHQSQPMHDMPWDFFRFSDMSWHALFNRRTGFEVLAAEMSMPVHMVPRIHPEQPANAEQTLGFRSSDVLVRKIGPAEVDWTVKLTEVIDSMYPTDKNDAAVAR